MGHLDKVKRIKKWTQCKKHANEVVCLQKLKISKEKARFQMDLINSKGTQIMDADLEGVVGAAILIPKHYKVVAHGGKGDRTLAWARILTTVGELNISSVYAPNEPGRRKELWTWMTDNLTEAKWVVCGDWNMLELWDDSVGHNALLHGNEARAWNQLAENGTWWTIIYAWRIGRDPSLQGRQGRWTDWTN